MRIGIVILPDERWSVAGRRWQRAEEYGFDHAWTYDHIGWRDLVDGPWFDAVPTLTAAAMVTRRIQLGTYVASPNFRHPVPFVRSALTLDDISQGRLLLGVGAGGTGHDTSVLGGPVLPPRERVDRFAEFLEITGQLLNTDHVSYQGQYYTAVDARNRPGPTRKPRTPLLVAAAGPRSLKLAARHGDGWITYGDAAAEGTEEWWTALARQRDRFEAALAETGRDPATVSRYLTLDSAPGAPMSSADAFTDATSRAAELGFTDVVGHWPRASGWYAGSEKTLETVAGLLPKLRKI
ncbi:LLM class flavin-dependent oxidoreductase [Actinoplanes sp. NPDC049265]|uniref:LLM class flavin-dependent oxidoreductase n=1 Tax=Actinoplanes sp. NPDC049265 TaxID=3363902 RepID=UPI003718DDB7